MKTCSKCKREIKNRNKSGMCKWHALHPMQTHGMSKTTEYKAWCEMRARCENPKNTSYERYGAKGVKVCERWNKFENFIEDMGMKPDKTYSIDRIDSTGNYEPSNCRWADIVTQARNKKSVMIYKGKIFSEWDSELGLKPGTMKMRVTQYGWSMEKAVNTPKKAAKNYSYDKARKKWVAHTTIDAKYVFIGRYDTEDEAKEAAKNFKQNLT